MSAADKDAPNIFDCHLHIIDKRYPLVPNNGYLPEPFSCQDYLSAVAAYPVVGGAVVSGSFQAYDQTYLIAALKELGPGFVGVTQLPVTVTDEEVFQLDKVGVRAVRFNLRRGGSEGVQELDAMARRIYELVGWHVELYVDAARLDFGLANMLRSLPAVSIDHLGLSAHGLATLRKLAEGGCRIKATGFGRLDFDAVVGLEQIYQANPKALMFGTDLPSTRAPRPFHWNDLYIIEQCLGAEGARQVMCDNALEFYRIPRVS